MNLREKIKRIPKETREQIRNYVVNHVSPLILATGICFGGIGYINNRLAEEQAVTEATRIRTELNSYCQQAKGFESVDSCLQSDKPSEILKDTDAFIRSSREVGRIDIFTGIGLSVLGLGIKVWDSTMDRRSKNKPH